mmetsp:Transcript_691/g.1385  ORF Transcript_691/g.1385 Transcript_691/m.1385 type:complete len:273 (-) Transcript_691:56-874(-)
MGYDRTRDQQPAEAEGPADDEVEEEDDKSESSEEEEGGMDGFSDDDGPLPTPVPIVRSQDVEVIYEMACRVAEGKPVADKALLSPPSINSSDGKGTAVFKAVEQKRDDVLKVLVEHKANPNAKDAQGNTPLMMAAKKMRAAAMGILLAAGAEVDACDSDKGTALMVATSMGDPAGVQVLLGAKADVNRQNSDGDSALQISAYNDSLPCVEALLQVDGVDLELKDAQGRTALLSAARFGSRELVQALLTAGASTAVTDAAKNTFQSLMEERED